MCKHAKILIREMPLRKHVEDASKAGRFISSRRSVTLGKQEGRKAGQTCPYCCVVKEVSTKPSRSSGAKISHKRSLWSPGNIPESVLLAPSITGGGLSTGSMALTQACCWIAQHERRARGQLWSPSQEICEAGLMSTTV